MKSLEKDKLQDNKNKQLDSVKLDCAQDIIGHNFYDLSLLKQALTHPSANKAFDKLHDYQRLEFLGDSLLEAIVSIFIYDKFSDYDEGDLTKIRIHAVCGDTLTKVAKEMGLEDCIVFGASELNVGIRGLDSALEDVFEALVAAIFLDVRNNELLKISKNNMNTLQIGYSCKDSYLNVDAEKLGFLAAKKFVFSHLEPFITDDVLIHPDSYKSQLQNYLQAKGQKPIYKQTDEVGPDHSKTFKFSVSSNGHELGCGEGRSKKEAEEHAAKNAYLRLIQNASK
ncbi:MAG: ribonuclease III [Coriobacteriales bacterium]|nr:ribonuclease III [Coriobacteriales bacterium]